MASPCTRQRCGKLSCEETIEDYLKNWNAEQQIKEKLKKDLDGILGKWPAQLKKIFLSEYSDNNNLKRIDKILIDLRKKHPDYCNFISEALATLVHYDRISNKPDSKKKNVLEEKTPEIDYIPECSSSNETHKGNLIYKILLAGIVLIAFVYFYANNQMSNVETNNGNKLEEWKTNLLLLQEKFPSQKDDTWYTFLSGIKSIVTEKPVQPSVILLLHNDSRTSACLAQSVGKEAVKLLSDTPHEPLIIHGKDLKSNKSLINEYGLFTETYKHDIKERHVMIVLDLQEIPPVLAQTFHVLCDIENPLVPNAAFLFTMQIDQYGTQIDQYGALKFTAIAEKQLGTLWKGSIDTDIVDPLIVRVTNSVLQVMFETHLPCERD